jgi:TetR/AcrR family transcriptional regulator, transcriptional repressor for nem operon
MPRPKSQSREALRDHALSHFWAQGYGATSVDDLVTALGTNRHSLYAAFGGKQPLFLACLDAYQDQVVTPAFAQVEAEGATLDAVAAYLEYQIARAEEAGLPGSGCLIANVTAEIGARDAAVLVRTEAHHARLHAGFLGVLAKSDPLGRLSPEEHDGLASLMVVAAQGLWSFSRTTDDPEVLRSSARALLDLVRRRLSS